MHDWAYNSLLSVVYTTFLIVLMVSKVLDDWPYPFLAADSPMCFGWYLSMIISNMLFYSLAWKLGDLKCKYFSNGLENRDSHATFNENNISTKLERPLLFS